MARACRLRFGLLHGFGFAGALTSIGLPSDEVPLALLTFNVGVELGQLLFVAVVLAMLAVVRRLAAIAPVAAWGSLTAIYAIGAVAAFWFLERVATLAA